MRADHFLQTLVESLAFFMKDHRVRIAIKFLKAEARIVFMQDLEQRLLEHIPRVVHVRVVDCGLKQAREVGRGA